MSEQTLMKRDGFELTFDDADTFRLYDHSEKWGDDAIFETDQFRPGAMSSNDADDSIGSVLGFFSCGAHDVDAEYFVNYTSRQIEWRDSRAEELGYISCEIGDAWTEANEEQDGKPDHALHMAHADDGTLDTVVSVYDPMTGETYEERFSDVVEREEDGSISGEAWADLRERIDADHWQTRQDALDEYGSIFYEVIVGNIGTVHSGTEEDAALEVWFEYRSQSKEGYGSAGGEAVTLMEDGEPAREYLPGDEEE